MNVFFGLLLSLLLVSCSGGGGGGASSSLNSLTGIAMDGYLEKATAFLDLNGNGALDSGEPSSTTNETGVWTLYGTKEQFDTYKVVVIALAKTTIDKDNPDTTIASGYTMMTPEGNQAVVSPLTTLVVAKMNTGLSLANAKTAVQEELGLTSVDVMKDFVAAKATDANYAAAHNVAASIAEVLKTIDADASKDTKLADKLSSLTTKVTTQVVPNITEIKSASSTQNAVKVAAIPQSIKISADSNSFASGRFTPVSALATLSDKTTKAVTSAVDWVVSTVSGSGTASVSTSADGTKFTSTGPGVFSLIGKYLGLTDTISVTVTDAVEESIKATPMQSSFVSGTSTLLSSLVTFSDKTTKNISAAVEWVVSTVSGSGTASVATSADGTKITSTGPGVFSLIAKYLGLTDTITVTVTDAVEESITISSVLSALANGATTTLNAVATFTDKTTKNVSNAVEWVVNTVSGGGSAYVSSSNNSPTLFPSITGTIGVIAKYLGFTSNSLQITINCESSTPYSNPFMPPLPPCSASQQQQEDQIQQLKKQQMNLFGIGTLGTAKLAP